MQTRKTIKIIWIVMATLVILGMLLWATGPLFY